MKEDGKNLEMVFCSSDRDEASFMEYFKEMPWLALPFGDKRKTALSRMFSVQGKRVKTAPQSIQFNLNCQIHIYCHASMKNIENYLGV